MRRGEAVALREGEEEAEREVVRLAVAQWEALCEGEGERLRTLTEGVREAVAQELGAGDCVAVVHTLGLRMAEGEGVALHVWDCDSVTLLLEHLLGEGSAEPERDSVAVGDCVAESVGVALCAWESEGVRLPLAQALREGSDALALTLAQELGDSVPEPVWSSEEVGDCVAESVGVALCAWDSEGVRLPLAQALREGSDALALTLAQELGDSVPEPVWGSEEVGDCVAESVGVALCAWDSEGVRLLLTQALLERSDALCEAVPQGLGESVSRGVWLLLTQALPERNVALCEAVARGLGGRAEGEVVAEPERDRTTALRDRERDAVLLMLTVAVLDRDGALVGDVSLRDKEQRRTSATNDLIVCFQKKVCAQQVCQSKWVQRFKIIVGRP